MVYSIHQTKTRSGETDVKKLKPKTVNIIYLCITVLPVGLVQISVLTDLLVLGEVGLILLPAIFIPVAYFPISEWISEIL